eukprot:CAMPEP_0114128562 /NCGR_PEP_ID=MMETSP0043_2-20121206/11000_1 /TAXON_ID=464988 /ORGANISM="Hemiselmis andersenii, Strain CCMP644" /LENGTH=57 /DNA_ID=CAMNT_0001221763 /DNA_START=294 /DNA_END=467 /DNA_ORIENTATION=+
MGDLAAADVCTTGVAGTWEREPGRRPEKGRGGGENADELATNARRVTTRTMGAEIIL